MKGSSGSTTSTTQNDVAPWLRPYYQQIASEAQNLYQNQDYPTYDVNQRQAPLSEDTLGAMSFIRNNAYEFVPAMQDAVAAGAETIGMNPNGYKDYENPYIEDVLSKSRESLRKQYEMDLNANTQREQKIGAFGGDRTAIAERQIRDSFADKISTLEANTRANAFQQANQNYQTDRMNSSSAATNYLNQANAAQQGVNGAALQQLAVGETLDERSQNLADMKYSDYINEQNWQRSKLADYANTIYPQGQTFGSSSTTQTQKSGGSAFGRILGTALAVGSMAIPGGGTIAGSLFGSSILGSTAGSAAMGAAGNYFTGNF